MIIYKSDGTIRATIEPSEDAELSLKISDECSFTTKVELSSFVNFSVGDYVTVFGNKYHIDKKPTPTKNGTNNYSWTLKFVDSRSYLSGVDFYLSDGTTLLPYDSNTIYCFDAVCSSGSSIWRYKYLTASSNHTPAENDYWTIINVWDSGTAYTKDVFVFQSDVVYRCLVSNTGQLLTNETYWSIVNTSQSSDFSTVLSPKDYAKLICDCMNAETTQNWVVGSCLTATPKEQTFSDVQCLDAAASIAELFETEVYVDMDGSNYRINFIKQTYTASPQVSLSQGEGHGLTDISVNENTGATKVTRLKAKGGTKNINSTYRNGSDRLLLPNVQYIDSSLRDATDPHNVTVTWDDVYPAMTFGIDDYNSNTKYYVGDQIIYNNLSYDCITETTSPAGSWNAAYWSLSEGQISEVLTIPTAATTKFKFNDIKLTFNPLDSAYIMADNTVPKVHFVTGNMAGYEFPITDTEALDGGGYKITIEQIQDSTDSNIPTVGYMFSVGDEYFFVDLYMPQSYVNKAEQRLLAKAQEYLAKYEKDQITYSCNVDIIAATNSEMELHIGELILLTDSDFGLSNVEYRIVELRRKYRKPYKYDIVLSDLPYEPTRITKIENSTESNTDTINKLGLTSVMAQSRTFQGAQEAINKAFDPSGEYFTKVIKPLIIETSAVLVGTNEQQFDLTGLSFSTKTNLPNYIQWDGGTIYNGNLDEPHIAWNISGGNATMSDPTKSYYCYIVAERATASTYAYILFDEAQHLTKENPLLYYFLVGTLGTVKNNFRQFWTSYGFTFVDGGTITTNEIRNSQGTVILGLGSERLYIGTTDAEKYIDMDSANGAFRMKNITMVSTSGTESPLPVFCGAYSASSQYYVGDTVTYTGSTWRCVANCLNQTPQEGTYWTIEAAKGDQGAQGEQGIQGSAGVDGQDGASLYTWVKYGDDSSGSGMSDYPSGKLYIGLAYNKTTQTESTTPGDYQWALIKGDQGIQGPTGSDGITYYTWLKYADSPTSGMSDDPTGKIYMGIAYNKITPTESTSYGDYAWSLIKGADGITTYTWIKYASDSSGTGITDDPTGMTYIGFAYNKTTQTESTTPGDYTWSLIKGETGNTGEQGLPGADGVTTYTWIKYSDYSDGTDLYDTPTTNTMYIGIAVNKTTPTESSTKTDYTWSKFKGDQGVPGTNGTTITSITEEYYLSTSKTEQSGGSWVTTPPTWSSGMYMWTRSKIVYANPTSTEYTTPLVDSSWEAVNEIQVGGVNLFLGSNSLNFYTERGDFPTYASSAYAVVNGIMETTITSLIADTSRCYKYQFISGYYSEFPKSGKDYILSFDYKTNCSNSYIYIDLRDTDNSNILPRTFFAPNTNGEWKRGFILCNWTITSQTVSLFSVKSGNEVGDYISYRKLKFEEGNKDTAWTIAPKDLQSQIDTTITSTDVEYYLSTSSTELAGGTWQTTAPTWVNGKYMWSRTKITYSSGTIVYSPSENGTCIAGAKGETGTTGNYYEHRYAVNGSPTIAPSITNTDAEPSGWSVSLPSLSITQYMWITTAQKTSAGVLIGTWSTPERLSGAVGNSGPAQSYKGVWDSGTVYVGNEIIVQTVYYESSYYITRSDAGSITAGTFPTEPSKWNSIGSSFESVATGLLLAQSAYIENLIVSQLATSSNPYADRLAVSGTNIGIFTHKSSESSINNAIIGMGKDISTMQESGQQKPAIAIRDKQWQGVYSPSTVYYKDDRVTYTGNGLHTYIFTHQWLESETPTSGILPTNSTYWSDLGTGDLGGGSVTEVSSEGIFANGGNMVGLSGSLALTANFTAAYLLQKRNSSSTGYSAAVFGLDQTDNSYGASESHGGWFNKLKADGLMPSTKIVTSSYTLTPIDTVVMAGSTSSITLTLPSSPVRCQIYMIRHITGSNVVINANGNYITSKGLSDEVSSITMSEWNAVILSWDSVNSVWWASWTVAK